MAWIDENGVLHSVSNNPLVRMFDALIHPIGYIPLFSLVAIFFIIKHYNKNRKVLMWYTIIASILYLIFLFCIKVMFYLVG